MIRLRDDVKKIIVWFVGYVVVVLVVSIIGNFTFPTALFAIALLLMILFAIDMRYFHMANMLDRRYERLHKKIERLEPYEKVPKEYILDYRKLERYVRNNGYVLKKYEDIYAAERQAVKKLLKGKC